MKKCIDCKGFVHCPKDPCADDDTCEYFIQDPDIKEYNN